MPKLLLIIVKELLIEIAFMTIPLAVSRANEMLEKKYGKRYRVEAWQIRRVLSKLRYLLLHPQKKLR